MSDALGSTLSRKVRRRLFDSGALLEFKWAGADGNLTLGEEASVCHRHRVAEISLVDEELLEKLRLSKCVLLCAS